MKTSNKVDGRPSFQFYPKDWRSDTALRLVTLYDRGLWMEMLCIMWESGNRGFLEANGNRLNAEQLACITGESEIEVKQSLSRMEMAGVFSTTEDGTIYSRRMTRDEKQRLSKVLAGRKGGFAKEASKKLADAKVKPPENALAKARSSSPTPSSSPSPTPKEETSKSDESPIFGDTGEEGNPPSREEAGKVAKALREAALEATGGKGKLQPKYYDTDRIMVLLSRSSYTPADLLAMIEFARGDPFWRAHVLSGGDLEKHADTLYAKMQEAEPPKEQGRPQPPMVNLSEFADGESSSPEHVGKVVGDVLAKLKPQKKGG